MASEAEATDAAVTLVASEAEATAVTSVASKAEATDAAVTSVASKAEATEAAADQERRKGSSGYRCPCCTAAKHLGTPATHGRQPRATSILHPTV